jgi:hypothetical protein
VEELLPIEVDVDVLVGRKGRITQWGGGLVCRHIAISDAIKSPRDKRGSRGWKERKKEREGKHAFHSTLVNFVPAYLHHSIIPEAQGRREAFLPSFFRGSDLVLGGDER